MTLNFLAVIENFGIDFCGCDILSIGSTGSTIPSRDNIYKILTYLIEKYTPLAP